jgi:hypothetical protein
MFQTCKQTPEQNVEQSSVSCPQGSKRNNVEALEKDLSSWYLTGSLGNKIFMVLEGLWPENPYKLFYKQFPS